MKRTFILIFTTILAMTALTNCSSPQSLLSKGKYYQAVIEAVKKLRSKPDNAPAQEVLTTAYPLAQDIALRVVSNKKVETNNPNRHYAIVEQYENLNRLANEIYRSPAALKLVSQPREYVGELQAAKEAGAEEFYQLGINALRTREVQQARQALDYFNKATNFVPNYKDIAKRIEDANFYATLRVIVQRPLTNRSYQLSADFFFDNLMTELRRQGSRRKVEFYSEEEAKLASVTDPHQFVTLDFLDFTVGNARETNSEIDCKRDSIHVADAYDKEGNKIPAYATVKAKLRIYRLELLSQGILNVYISDAATKKPLGQQKFAGQYVWTSEWATYSGDDRALTEQQKRLVGRQREVPPLPQDLFVEFTKPIFTQTVSYLINYYSRY
ncbi:MAG: hypothetical protein LBB41_05980 [Prevotellaceae bacterium]|jgi:hypothetical protein|nr:hypothetical protein [Prevotellaceae bacterium]